MWRSGVQIGASHLYHLYFWEQQVLGTNNKQESINEIQRGSTKKIRGSKLSRRTGDLKSNSALVRRSTEDTYLLSVRCPTTAPASWKNKSPLSLSHTAYSHSHPPLPAMFAPVILRHYSLPSPCQRNLKAWRSIHYKRNQETVQQLWGPGEREG